MTDPKLLPCPFCGCDAVFEPNDRVPHVHAFGRASCSNDDCALVDEPGNSVQIRPFEWNRRADLASTFDVAELATQCVRVVRDLDYVDYVDQPGDEAALYYEFRRILTEAKGGAL